MDTPAGLGERAGAGRDLSSIVKAYDIRGVVPDELDEDVARRIGAAVVHALGVLDGSGAVVVGRDMRASSPSLVAAFTDGVTAQGADVVDIGLAATDQLYYASGRWGLPGAMVTASHNPARYNGIKLCRPFAAPVGQDSGLAEVRALAEAGQLAAAAVPGSVRHEDVLRSYAKHLRSLVDPSSGRRLRVVVDAGNGMAGHTAPAVLGALPLDVEPLYFELDGTFPHHEPNPIDSTTLSDLQDAVRRGGADLGLAFDGDADRCFLVDERGRAVSPSALTALIAERELRRHPGARVVHNLITSRAVPEVVREHGGTPVRTRVGHSFIKATMAESGAVFGGEHSGHFYFRDFWCADSGMLAALHALAALGDTAPGTTASALFGGYERYASSGELNSTVADPSGTLDAVRAVYGPRPELTLDDLDGLTVEHRDWWFNLRPSNTEPLLRLNVEGSTAAAMAAVRDEVLSLVRGADAASGIPG